MGLESKYFRISVFSLKPNGFRCSFLQETSSVIFRVESKTYDAIKLLCGGKNSLQMARRRATYISNPGDAGARINLPLSVHVINANAVWYCAQGMGGVAFSIGTRTLFAHLSRLINLIAKHGSRPQNGKSLIYLRETTCSGVFKGRVLRGTGRAWEAKGGESPVQFGMWRPKHLGFPCFLQSLTAFRVWCHEAAWLCRGK